MLGERQPVKLRVGGSIPSGVSWNLASPTGQPMIPTKDIVIGGYYLYQDKHRHKTFVLEINSFDKYCAGSVEYTMYDAKGAVCSKSFYNLDTLGKFLEYRVKPKKK